MAFRSNIKVGIAKAICHPVVGRLLSWAFGDRIPSGGCTIDTSSDLVTSEVKAYLFWGLYESAEIRFVSRYIRRDLDVIELGSSLGVVTCQIRKRIDDSCKLVCVEASPELAEITMQNLSINGLSEGVFITRKAIDYDSSGRKSVFLDGRGNSLGGMIAHQQSEAWKLSAETITLSQIIAENGIGDYVLVSDIEGAEAGMVLKEKEALVRCKQLIIELHDAELDGLAVHIEQTFETLTKVHGFVRRDRYGPVCVFER
jgi:FkbM family methyltransferase